MTISSQPIPPLPDDDDTNTSIPQFTIPIQTDGLSSYLCLGKLLRSKPKIELILIGFIPAFTIIIFGLLLRNMILAMFVMHIMMILCPIAYLLTTTTTTTADSVFKWYSVYFKLELSHTFHSGYYRTLILSILSFILTTLCGSLIYLMLQCSGRWWELLCIGSYESQLDKYGLGGLRNTSLFIDILLAIYFIIVNPIIEECFWRIFLIKELSATSTITSSPPTGEVSFQALSTNEQVDDIEVGRPHEMDEVTATRTASNMVSCNMDTIPAILRSSSESINWLGCALYGSYHILVVWALLNSAVYGILAFILLILVGRLLIWIIQSEQAPNANISGFTLATAIHSALDTVVVFALAAALRIVEVKGVN